MTAGLNLGSKQAFLIVGSWLELFSEHVSNSDLSRHFRRFKGYPIRGIERYSRHHASTGVKLLYIHYVQEPAGSRMSDLFTSFYRVESSSSFI